MPTDTPPAIIETQIFQCIGPVFKVHAMYAPTAMKSPYAKLM